MPNLIEFMSGTTSALVAGRFGLECDWGLLDMSYHLNDQVMANTPVVLTSFYGSQDYTYVTGRNKRVSTRPNTDQCGYSVVNYWIDQCDFLSPEQKEVAIGLEKQREKELVEKLCRGRVFRGDLSIFNTDGSIRAGTEIGESFVEYQLAELAEANADHHQDIFWTGNPANKDEYQGIWDQIINGHTPKDQAQDCQIKALQLDWLALTAGAGSVALPTDTIDAANDTFVAGPYTFTGMTGLNMVDVMLKWYRFTKNVLLNSKGAAQWEFWGPIDGVECIAEAAACTQPCGGADAGDDPTTRGRVQDAVESLTINLYPHSEAVIPILQTPYMNSTNRMVFGPRSVGNSLLRAMTFRAPAEADAILQSAFGELNGRRLGSFNPTNFIPREVSGPLVDMEESVFQSRHQSDLACIQSWVTSCGVPLVFGQNLFLVFNNVACAPQISPIGTNAYDGELVFSEAITSCAAGSTASSLTIGFANAAANFDACGLGDTILVTAVDGTTYSGEITVITTVTPALIEVDFGFEEISDGVPLDCTLSGGIDTGVVEYGC